MKETFKDGICTICGKSSSLRNYNQIKSNYWQKWFWYYKFKSYFLIINNWRLSVPSPPHKELVFRHNLFGNCSLASSDLFWDGNTKINDFYLLLKIKHNPQLLLTDYMEYSLLCGERAYPTIEIKVADCFRLIKTSYCKLAFSSSFTSLLSSCFSLHIITLPQGLI